MLFEIPDVSELAIIERLYLGHPEFLECRFSIAADTYCTVCSYRDCPKQNSDHYSYEGCPDCHDDRFKNTSFFGFPVRRIRISTLTYKTKKKLKHQKTERTLTIREDKRWTLTSSSANLHKKKSRQWQNRRGRI
jgi:hypothetical protein